MFRKVWGRQLIIALGVALVIVLVAATASFAAPAENPSNWWCSGVVVQPGQTLSGIAAHYGVSVWALASYNGIGNPNYIRAGQCIMIPAKGSGYWHGNWNYNNNCCSYGYNYVPRNWGWNSCCNYNYYKPTGHWVWWNGCWVWRSY
ncbi:MAG: LysM peptidoglycan-binding domain-containing protein [Anaerolineae bacterium]